ncbi:hypothetical protein BC939DRAFT_468290 [Gamsiella multidivaricata]|uniref:uncharacterized protein n=1 Tax=Gamsiella multidivaricata TaxID=101098 RepID=UPI00221EAAF2|nr:uncharacterized protein BC939DRAFT_468290 [Gamsiella multidivaricata]KAI7816654.1 hypothetical protein BC939DRAFT_468290 [Gamsiella multidivaricata]
MSRPFGNPSQKGNSLSTTFQASNTQYLASYHKRLQPQHPLSRKRNRLQNHQRAGWRNAATMMKYYLAHNQAMRKNTAQETLATSQKVSVGILQTPVQIGPFPSFPAQAAMAYDSLRKQLDCLFQWYSQMQKEIREAREAERRTLTANHDTKTR